MTIKNLDIINRTDESLTFIFEKRSYTMHHRFFNREAILDEFGVDYEEGVDSLHKIFNSVLDVEDYRYSILMDNKTLWVENKPKKQLSVSEKVMNNFIYSLTEMLKAECEDTKSYHYHKASAFQEVLEMLEYSKEEMQKITSDIRDKVFNFTT